MSVFLTSNFLKNTRGLTLSDGGGVTWAINKNTNVITATVTSGATLSSVGLADSSATPIYTVANSPLVANGTITLTLNVQAKNTVLAGPTTGVAAQPTFRALVAGDVPDLGGNPANKVELAAANGSATTYLRADCTLALDQAISPTWSSTHTFSNSIVASAGVQTYSGNSGSLTNATATTIKALPNVTAAVYLVCAQLIAGAGDVADYNAVYLVQTSGTVAAATALKAGALLTVSVSGLNVQVTQSSGATQAAGANWSILRIF